jgi:16S rRNA G527 N7-methylase RsmG
VVGPMLREAIWAAQFYPVEGEFHLDIGSGAGFPALLLKVLVPRIALDMVESREKKCRFLETAAVRLGMEGIRIHHALLSDYLRTHGCGKSWDCISWKGLKMGTRDLRQLRAHAHTGTQVWMFHGRSPATEETDSINKEFELVRKEAVPGTRDSHLSIYRPR